MDSVAGAGTTFRIYLPAAGSAAAPAGRGAAAPAAGRAAGAAGHGETVLVVDDERALLEVTSRMLRRNGYATLEASTWEEALSPASSPGLELLLADSVMPGMSGQVLAGRIGQVRPGLRVLHMSGYASGSLSPQLGGAEAEAFLHKPFTADALLAKVRAALGSPPQD